MARRTGSIAVTDESAEIRKANVRIARQLGYPRPPADLPFAEVARWRALDDGVDRALALDVVVSCAHGFDLAAALTWLRATSLLDRLTPAETDYLDDLEDGLHLDDLARTLQVEALWALLWALSFADELDFGAGCGARAAALVPALDDPAGARSFRAEATLREGDELVAALDLARCITAGLGSSDVSIGYAPGEVEPYVVWERRRALEWLAGADWDADPATES